MAAAARGTKGSQRIAKKCRTRTRVPDGPRVKEVRLVCVVLGPAPRTVSRPCIRENRACQFEVDESAQLASRAVWPAPKNSADRGRDLDPNPPLSLCFA